MTPAMVRCLEWFAARTEPVSLFRPQDPSRTMIRRAEAAGYVERAKGHVQAGGFMLTAYQISNAGRTALSNIASIKRKNPT